MPPKNKKQNRVRVKVSEECRIMTENTIRTFMQDYSVMEYTFPNTLTNVERAYVHDYARKYGLKTKSVGKEPNRCLHLKKKNKMSTVDGCFVELGDASVYLIKSVLSMFPLSSREIADVVQTGKAGASKSVAESNLVCKTLVRIHEGQPFVPPPISSSKFEQQRKQLPISVYRETILKTIKEKQVCIRL